MVGKTNFFFRCIIEESSVLSLYDFEHCVYFFLYKILSV